MFSLQLKTLVPYDRYLLGFNIHTSLKHSYKFKVVYYHNFISISIIFGSFRIIMKLISFSIVNNPKNTKLQIILFLIYIK